MADDHNIEAVAHADPHQLTARQPRISYQRIELYAAVTGEWFLAPDEQKSRAEQENARVDQYEALLKTAGLL